MNRLYPILIAALLLSGCALDELRHEGRSDAGRAFSVEQAKEFFETDYADMLTRSQGDDTRAGRFRDEHSVWYIYH